MLIILFLFFTAIEACIPTQQVEDEITILLERETATTRRVTTTTTITTTTTASTCPVCGTIYERNCDNTQSGTCESAATVGAYPTLTDGVCQISTTCTDSGSAYYYTSTGDETYDHMGVYAHCFENEGIWYYGENGWGEDTQLTNYICLTSDYYG